MLLYLAEDTATRWRFVRTITNCCFRMKRQNTRSLKNKRPVKRQKSFDTRVVQAMRRRADLKSNERGQGYTYVGATGQSVSVLDIMTRGDGSVNNFQGEKIVPLRWTFRYTMEAYGVLESAAESWTVGRILLCQWLAAGSAPAPGNILDLTVPGPLAPMSYKKWEGRKKYRILADTGPVPLNLQTAGGGGNGYVKSGQLFVQGSKMSEVYFDDLVGREKGDLFVLCISDSATSPGINFAWTSQMIYSDDY